MKIGVVTTSYPRFAGDPAGNFVEGHVEALLALGHAVEVIAAGDGADGGAFAARDHVPPMPIASPPRRGLVDRDAAIARRAATPTITRIASPLFYRGGAPDALEAHPARSALAAAAFTARLTVEVARRARGWDLAIAHWLAPSAIAALPGRAPIVAIAHGGDVHTLRRMHLLAPTLAALRARSARLVFVSEELRALAGAADAIVQPMGIAYDRFATLARAPIDPPTIVIASRLVPLKGVDVAIAAMAHLRAPARLVIAGDGPERAELAQLAGREALAHLAERDAGRSSRSWGNGGRDDGGDGEVGARVVFLGAVDTARRDQLLRTASVVVIPSRVTPTGRTEGTPVIALEALAAGVPVVASAVGGLRALDHVRLVPPDDPEALAAAIDGTLASPPAAEALRRSVAHLDWRAVAHHLMAT